MSTPIILEQIVNAPVEKVWKALSYKDEMKLWYFDLAEFRAEVGFKFQFYGGTEEKQYLHLCEIVKVIDNIELSYTWCYEGYPGNSLVSFELIKDGDKTKVKLTHKGVDSFAGDDPNMARESFEAGWNEIVKVSLKQYVE